MTTEIIEGEAVDVTTTAITRAPAAAIAPVVGIFELGAMDDAQYERQVAVITKGLERVKSLMRDLLVKDRDYLDFANLGNTGQNRRDERVGLLKSGSEALASYFHLVPEFTAKVDVTTFDLIAEYPDGPRPDRIDVDVTVLVHYGSLEGPVVGSGSGSATSWETKYHWRDAKPACTACGLDLRMSKDKPEWYCWRKTGGCGATYPAESIKVEGRVENPEPHELRNTLVKMASKRAWTDGVIRTLNASSLFTQDAEDRPQAHTVVTDNGREVEDDRWGEMNDPRAVPSRPLTAASLLSTLAPAIHTGNVMEGPDGIRRTDTGAAVVKFTMKVGRSKHHVECTGALAAEVMELDLKPEEPVAVLGVLEPRPWGDGTKPPMKYIVDVERVAVKRESGWMVREAVDQAPDPTDAGPAQPSRPSSTEPSPSSSTPTPEPSGPKDSPTATSSTPATEPDDFPEEQRFPASGDETGAIWGMPVVIDPNSPADTVTLVTPGTVAAPTNASTNTTLLEQAVLDGRPATGSKGEKISDFGVVASQEWSGEGDKRMVAMRVLTDKGLVYQCAAPTYVATTQITDEGGWRYAIGTRIRIIGAWARDDLVVLTGVVRA